MGSTALARQSQPVFYPAGQSQTQFNYFNAYQVWQNEAQFSFDYFSMYMADKYGQDWETKPNKAQTQKNEENYLTKFKTWLSDNGIVRPTRDDLLKYVDDLAERGLTAGTQSQYTREMKTFFKWCAVRGYYPDISDGVKGAKTRHDTHKRDALGRADVPQIAETIDRTTETGRRDYAIYVIMVSTATRCVELHRANVGDLRQESGKTFLYIQRKGHEEKDAAVEIIPDVLEVLNEYLDTRETPPTPDSPLFTSTSNNSKGGRIAATTIGAIMKRVLVSAGYDSHRLTGHSLRHTSITGCYNATKDPVLAQNHAGHADVSTTSIYIHEQERKDRTDEQDTYNYFFKADEQNTKREQAEQIIEQIPDDKLDTVLEILKAMK